MNATKINRLASLDPGHPYTMPDKDLSAHHPAVQRFLHVYANPAFGWYIAGRYAQCGKPLPVTMMGNDAWVHRAWLMRSNPRKWYNQHIAEALAMAQLDGLRMVGEKIKSAILAACCEPTNRDSQMRSIVESMGVSLNTLNAFEALFFNMFDRAMENENLAISEVVYPNTRIVEMKDDYLKSVEISDLLKRSAFNHGDLRMTLYLAGIGGSHYLSSLAERPDREAELSKRIMGNALVLSLTGMLNQRSIGLSRSQSLLAASRTGGVAEESSPLEGIGPMLIEGLSTIAEIHNEKVKAMISVDSGVTVDV